MIDHIAQSSRLARRVAGIDIFAGMRARYVLSSLFALASLLIVSVAVVLRIATDPVLASKAIIPLAGLLALLSHIPGIDIQTTGYFVIPMIPHLDSTALLVPKALGVWGGVLIFTLASYVFIKVLNVYVRSHYYIDLANIERGRESTDPQFIVQEVYARTRNGDIIGAFFKTDQGFLTALRVGLDADEITTYLADRPRAIDYRDRPGVANVKTFVELAEFVSRDPSLSVFFQSNGVNASDWRRAALWVSRERAEKDIAGRYWGRAALSKSLPIASDLAYGYGTYLKKFARELEAGSPRLHETYGSTEVSRVEALLSREVGANVLLVAPSTELGLEVVDDFARDIVYHFPHPSLRDKKCFILDTQSFTESITSRDDFESTIIAVAADSINAGNVILVIDDLAALYVRADQIGADLDAVLRKILASPLATIFIVDQADNARVVRSHAGTLDHMHEIKIDEASDDALLTVLEEDAQEIESSYGILITVPAIVRVARDAARTRVQGLLSVRAREILNEIPSWASNLGVRVITPRHVDDLVSVATGMPVGRADGDERRLLLSIEPRMHERVIGQDAAIDAIGAALRRARAGTRDENKPIASFLFLGPTGVGKTEVAKTLSETYFGGEAAMQRFDMSEYSSAGSLERLIGDASGPGLLTSAVREHPYGVLLIDEFEKADRSVHDLFLQILDEGVFHSSSGDAVNCRNLIIIATSNAGSREIRLAMSGGATLDGDMQKTILDAIIAAGVYRPELLNRFDGTILFSPLRGEDYRKIARLMLEKLSRRIESEHHVKLIVDDTLLDRVLQDGVNEDFGARPLARAIQEKVSDPLSEKLLREDIAPGTEVRI